MHSMGNYKDVLIGVVGTSPAVLTETLWALAQEDPAIVPAEVVILTTTVGKKRIDEALFKEGWWAALIDEIGASELPPPVVKLFNEEDCAFSDITSVKQNEVVADLILKTLQPYAEDEHTRIIASIAGGRKTMSALMLSCMSLLGRAQDRVCHVLANDQYINENKGFCFPENKEEVEAAQVQLSDIPFVRVSQWQNIKYAPPSYSGLVNFINTGELKFPQIGINPKTREVNVINGATCKIGPLSFGLLYFWIKWMGQPAIRESWVDFREYLESYFKDQSLDKIPYEWAHGFEKKYRPNERFLLDDDTLRKRMADVRKTLEELFRFPQLARTLVPDLQKKETFSFPLKNIRWDES